MSCHPERTYALYIDAALAPGERRTIESHLVQCRLCRELVVALREESELLIDVLQDRPHTAGAAAPAPAPARGIALGIVPTLALGLLAATALGWLLETFRPMADRWIAPFTLRGATDMAFELVFLLRDAAPDLFGAGLAVAAMASASALLTFALTALLRRGQGPTGLLLGGALLALLLPAAEGQAHFGIHEHEAYTLAAGETHDGTLIVSSRATNIDGIVAGDLIVLSHRLAIRGEVQGNVIAFVRDLEIPGHVRGTVHAAAGRIHVAGRTDANFYAWGETFALAQSGRIGRDALLAGESVVLEGEVGRDLFVGAERAELRGPVARDVHAWADQLVLLDGATLGGALTAMLPAGREVELASGAQVAGGVTRQDQRLGGPRGFARYAEGRFYVWLALHLAAAFAAGLLLRLLLPGVYDVRVETTSAFFRSLGLGFLVLVAMPVGIALCALTLIGIPVALMGLGLYLGALYVGGIVVAALIGSALVRPDGDGWGPFGLALIAGLAVLVIAGSAPLLGGVVRVVVLLLGLGLLTERSRRTWRSLRGLPA